MGAAASDASVERCPHDVPNLQEPAMKYLCLAYGDEKDWKALTKNEQEELLAQDEVLRQRGDLVAAVETTATIVRAWDGRPTTADGTFANSRIPLAGFSIIEADDEEEVIELVADTPCARAGGAVEVHPIAEMNDSATVAGSSQNYERVSSDTTDQTPEVLPEHHRLDVFIGKWRITGENKAGAGKFANTKVTGEETYEWMPGGFFVVNHWDRHFGDGRHIGTGFLGYDAMADQYSVHAFDNLGFMRTYEATPRGNRWTYAGKKERAEISFSDDGKTMTIHWDVTQDGSKWIPLCDLTGTKVK
jgi:hypothetical protein